MIYYEIKINSHMSNRIYALDLIKYLIQNALFYKMMVKSVAFVGEYL